MSNGTPLDKRQFYYPEMDSPIPTLALISGGKDSFFSLLHSNANGFKVIALANLHPPAPIQASDSKDVSDDLNSFMYQTVGYTVLPHYPTILGIPLYRAAIHGGSINQDLSYHPGSNPTSDQRDEIEDLYELVKKVKEEHPNLKAVCSGAILSSYQRTRVESVCQRLGLISVAWLWQRRQECVLSEMEEVGLDARIIKVASLGLDEKWLGKNVADSRTRIALENLKRKWGSGNVAGEGGEFETLVMGCRGWPKRVEVKASEIVNEDGDVAWTRFLETSVVDVSSPGEPTLPPKPPILDAEFQQIINRFESKKITNEAHSIIQLPPPPTPFQISIQKSTHNIYVANMHADSGDAEQQVTSIFRQLRDHLQAAGSCKRQVTSTLLLLRSMTDFKAVNKIYSSNFSAFPNPPSRVCIAIGESMPAGIDVLLSVTVDIPQEHDRRKALHVQSRSYWAPANVGPYSQAIAVGGIVSVAGMIGLVPESMKVWETQGIKGETALALQSMVRVGREMSIHGTKGWLGGVGYTVNEKYIGIMQDIWLEWFTQDSNHESAYETTIEGSDDGEDDAALESYFERSDENIEPPRRRSFNSKIPPPLLVLQVAQLPIGSNVEFACLGIDSAFVQNKFAGEDAYSEDDNPSESSWNFETSSFESSDGTFQYTSVKIGPHKLIWGVTNGDIDGVATGIKHAQGEEHSPTSLTLYLSPAMWESAGSLTKTLLDTGFSGIGCLPVFGLSWTSHYGGREGAGFRIAFSLRLTRKG
ncbi:hypothetical protein H072_1917 [Dactylellina haptotyla CBS 200.50]|uniref:Diphthine--ammonia ligase n=1 Tax=Dactylellina haptotyla (strain CBS 200.50) TaxID=1284197 RepID=S8AM76_DACHA|nr:hypothetical protein H072_1917 [Dactylellina haptotyla CBS 200.50]